MAGRGEMEPDHASPPRPHLVSQSSYSVPSTPHQHARDAPPSARTPSPNGDLGSHSPRSVSSEANGVLPTLRKPRAGCKYETSAAFGRRRIPYNIGADLLEKAAEPPKESLTLDEDTKLSDDMKELYRRLLPSEESESRRTKLVRKLDKILHDEWPGSEFRVHVFGSSGNMLCTSESDVDICIQTDLKRLETMHILAEALAKHGMERVICVASAKVPIIRIWDPEYELACDINVNNTLALENTRMIKTYVQIDERVRPLAMIIKHWTKQRILNDAALGGTLSSYTWICMIISFLQTREPPVLPALHQIHKGENGASSGNGSAFADDLTLLQGFGKANKESIAQLLFHFFRRYGHEIDYEVAVISVRQGRIVSRKEKGWDLESLSKEGRDRLCVEEPFNTSRNLGNSADPTAFRGIHLELRRAFELLAKDGRLDECCQQFEFPPEEKLVWKKPPPAPKPTLTRSNSHSGRGGRGSGPSRGGRNHISQKSNPRDRRASSGAAFGNMRLPLGQASSHGLPSAEYLNHGNLHDHLFQQYQFLQFQQDTLKAHLIAQAQAQAHAQAHAQAQAQAQANAQNHAHSRTPATAPIPQHPTMEGYASPQLAAIEPLVSSASPLQGYLFHYPPYYDRAPPLSQSPSQDGTGTNPASPAFAHAVPALRRGLHRPSVADGAPTGSIRSQSQPARPVNNVLAPQVFFAPTYDHSNVNNYPISHVPHNSLASQGNPEPLSHGPGMLQGQALDHSIPKEYVGYCVDDSLHHARAPVQPFYSPQLPSSREGLFRRHNLPPDTMHHLPPPFRRLSRSPSPLAHQRSQSAGLRSAPLSGPSSHVPKLSEPEFKSEGNGLLIVNGSVPTMNLPVRDRQNDRADRYSRLASTEQQHPVLATSSITNPEDHVSPVILNGGQHRRLLYDIVFTPDVPSDSISVADNFPGNPSAMSNGELRLEHAAALQPSPTLPESLFPNPHTETETTRSHPGISSSVYLQHELLEDLVSSNDIPHLDIVPTSLETDANKVLNGAPLVSPTCAPKYSWRETMQSIEHRKDSLATEKVPYADEVHDNDTLELRQTVARAKENDDPIQAAKGSHTLVEKQVNGNAAGSSQLNPWQKQAKRGARKKNKSMSIQQLGSEVKLGPEVMPSNEADRKGG